MYLSVQYCKHANILSNKILLSQRSLDTLKSAAEKCPHAKIVDVSGNENVIKILIYLFSGKVLWVTWKIMKNCIYNTVKMPTKFMSMEIKCT